MSVSPFHIAWHGHAPLLGQVDVGAHTLKGMRINRGR